MNQEQLPQPAEQRPTSPEGIRTSPQSSRKGVARLLGLGLVIVVIIVVAARYALPKFALANFEPTLKAKTAPLSASPAKISEHATDGSSAIPPGQPTPFSADTHAQNFWAEFAKSRFGASLEDWSRLHAEISCKPFRGRAWELSADRQWSHRCSTGDQPEAAHWSFYVFDLQEPVVPRLEQFDMTTATLPEEALGALQSQLQGYLDAHFGLGEDQSGPKPVLTYEVSWPRNVRWRDEDVEIHLDLVEFDPQRKKGRLRLLERQLGLLKAMNEDNRLQLVGTSYQSYEYYKTGSGIDAQLADNLRPDFPDVANMLMKYEPDPDPRELAAFRQKQREAIQQQLQKQRQAAQGAGRTGIAAFAIAVPQPATKWKAEEFHAALARLLDSVKTSPPVRQPIMLWAADRLAWRLPLVIADDKSLNADWTEWQTQLAALGVTYGPPSEGDGPLAYSGDLLKRIWTNYGQSDWGERAFLVLQSHGWDMAPSCEGGSDQFRAVIQQGRQFLEQHRNSPYQLDVQLTVAQAYETWWSLSLPPVRGQTVTAEEEDYERVVYQRYQEGAEEARQKAIAYYERLLQTAPQSDQAAYARRVLPRLKLGIDTGQRRFYCIYED